MCSNSLTLFIALRRIKRVSVHVEYHLMKSVAEKETRKAGH